MLHEKAGTGFLHCRTCIIMSKDEMQPKYGIAVLKIVFNLELNLDKFLLSVVNYVS